MLLVVTFDEVVDVTISVVEVVVAMEVAEDVGPERPQAASTPIRMPHHSKHGLLQRWFTSFEHTSGDPRARRLGRAAQADEI
ncbi:MAG TPA: hypothetical protein VE569_09120 [Acidimicrobiia bacterium]|nr:hypothetical protein [Acidimicrobiia bacterium]